MDYYFLIILPIAIFFVNSIIKKKKLILNYSGEKHQKFFGKNNIPLSGGIFLFFTSIFILYNNYSVFFIFLSGIFFLGFFSDINFLVSPKSRFFIQSIIVFIFVYYSKLHVGPTRIYFLDLILNNIFLSYFFTTFCLMIVINGSNFIDGLNGLLLGYYLMVLLIIYKLNLFTEINLELIQINLLIGLLTCLLLFNLFNQFFMGDGGAYSLGFILSFFLISIYQNNQIISPFFVILLLWYPCFENLFSIIRKFRINKSPIKPDSKHFHQLLFLFIKKKFRLKNNYANNLGSLIIILYNLCIFTLGAINVYSTKLQALLIFLSIVIYIIIYLKLLSLVSLKNNINF